MKNKLLFLSKAYLPPIVWAAVIYLLSSESALPSFEVSFYDFVFKKCAHMFVFGILYFLIFRAVNFQSPAKTKNWFFPFLICFIYALLDELHQSFTPNRSPTFRDVGYDLLGTAIAFSKIHNFI